MSRWSRVLPVVVGGALALGWSAGAAGAQDYPGTTVGSGLEAAAAAAPAQVEAAPLTSRISSTESGATDELIKGGTVLLGAGALATGIARRRRAGLPTD